MNLWHLPLSRKKDIVSQEIGKEILIYDLKKNKVFCLNETSSMVWLECSGKNTVAEISHTLSKKLKTIVNEDIVWLALSQLKKDDLLEKSEEFVTPIEGLSRREVVRRIGFASMVALPVISAVIAPTSLSAQSGGGGQCFPADNQGSDSAPGCECVGTFDCCGLCAQGVCGGPNRPANSAQNDPGAAPVCFGNLACFPADNGGSNSAPGCPCIGTFDCCGLCAGGICGGPNRPANPPQNDPGAAPICP